MKITVCKPAAKLKKLMKFNDSTSRNRFKFRSKYFGESATKLRITEPLYSNELLTIGGIRAHVLRTWRTAKRISQAQSLLECLWVRSDHK